MKLCLFIIASLITVLARAQNEIKIFFENKNPGYALFASNNAIYPMSIELELNLENLRSSKTDKIFVIPANTSKFSLGELSIVNPNERNKFAYRFRSVLGDVTMKADTAYVYDLPLQKDKPFHVFQGYNGSFSHQMENALDFTMPEGTEVFAAREGLVVKVVQENNQSCGTEECTKYNNYVTIAHLDGTFAQYTHIKYNGSKVKVGDNVKKGDMVAYSGNTGWSNGPHLHFVCYSPGFEKRKTIPTKFRVDDGKTILYLKEKQLYGRGY